ncbi:EVI2B protein, partial [Regulus satrapa]|nr:EVI2B protein [Regulus satrapa]
MASDRVTLLLLGGEIWSCLSAAAPPHAATTARHRRTKLPLDPIGPSAHPSDRPLGAAEPPAFPGDEEAEDGSWVAALILGLILIAMALAITVILLWKCCRRPALAESHWAGRSPFVDGDTPDLLMDSDQGTKRSSVLFMLPWRLKQGANSWEDPSVSESPARHSGSAENGQPPPRGSAAPAPASEPAKAAAGSCPAPDTPPECSELPAPPEWLREAPEEPGSGPSKHSALDPEAEEPGPSPAPPEPLSHESHETLPQPEHPS